MGNQSQRTTTKTRRRAKWCGGLTGDNVRVKRLIQVNHPTPQTHDKAKRKTKKRRRGSKEDNGQRAGDRSIEKRRGWSEGDKSQRTKKASDMGQRLSEKLWSAYKSSLQTLLPPRQQGHNRNTPLGHQDSAPIRHTIHSNQIKPDRINRLTKYLK